MKQVCAGFGFWMLILATLVAGHPALVRAEAGDLSIGYIQNSMSLIAGSEADMESVCLSGLLADPLASADANGKLIPMLLKDDGDSLGPTQYVFHLKPGLRWSNGNPITGADVAASFYAWNNKYSQRRSWSMMSRFISSVRADPAHPGDFTVRLAGPLRNPMRFLVLPVFPASSLTADKFTDDYKNSVFPCNGPMRLKDVWTKTGNNKLLPNKYYFKPWPELVDFSRRPIESLDLKYYPSFQNLSSALKSQDVRFYPAYPYSEPYDQSVLSAKDLLVGNITAIVINCRENYVSENVKERDGHFLLRQSLVQANQERNQKVRKALDLIIDRNELLFNHLQIAVTAERAEGNFILCGPLPAFVYPPGDAPPMPVYDRGTAETLLREAGLVRNSQGKWEYKGAALTLSFLVRPVLNPSLKKTETFIQREFQKFGITVESINTVTQSDYDKRLDDGSFDIALYSGLLPAEDYLQSQQRFFVSGDPMNFSRYMNKDVNRLLAVARDSEDLKQSKEKGLEASGLINKDYPWIFLYNMPYRVIYTKNFIHGMGTVVNSNDLFQNIVDWKTGK